LRFANAWLDVACARGSHASLSSRTGKVVGEPTLATQNPTNPRRTVGLAANAHAGSVSEVGAGTDTRTRLATYRAINHNHMA